MLGTRYRIAAIVVSIAAASATTCLGAQAAPKSETITTSWLNAVACPSRFTCVASGGKEKKVVRGSTVTSDELGTIAVGTTDGGSHWMTIPLPAVTNGVVNSVSCLQPASCVLVGESDLKFAGGWLASRGFADTVTGVGDGKYHVTASALPKGSVALNAVSCASKSDCVAAGGRQVPGSATLVPSVLLSTDGGAIWAQAKLPALALGGILYGLACPTPSQCVATGATFQKGPVAIRSGDGGETWVAGSISSNGGGPVAEACATPISCVAVGNVFTWCECGTSVAGNYARTWSTSQITEKSHDKTRTIPVGASYETNVVPQQDGYDLWTLDTVSCWSSAECYAGGDDSKPTPKKGCGASGCLDYPIVMPLYARDGWSGSSKSGQPIGHTLESQWIYGLSCRSATACVAVGQSYATGSANQAAIETSSATGWVARKV